VTLRFIYRDGCSLCEAMWAELRSLMGGDMSQIALVEISGDADLEAEYGDRIPVLEWRESEICRHFLDPDALRAVFERPAD